MNINEQIAHIYECRDTAYRLLGEKYHEMMQGHANIIRAVANRDNCNNIVAGATILKERSAQGMDALLIIAAVVEMTEPINLNGHAPLNIKGILR